MDEGRVEPLDLGVIAGLTLPRVSMCAFGMTESTPSTWGLARWGERPMLDLALLPPC